MPNTMMKNSPESRIKSFKNLLKVAQVSYLTENTYALRFDRGDFKFEPGQYVSVGVRDSLHQREYSLYSGEADDYLEILVREVLDGNVSVQLKQCVVGQQVEVNGPYGHRRISKEYVHSKKHVFIASGTGIAPFHSSVKSYKNMDYTLLHGVRYLNEGYGRNDYDPQRYILCTSRDEKGDYHGRVTDYLQDFSVMDDMLFYICGNSNMIFSAYDILRKKGVTAEDIHLEVYF